LGEAENPSNTMWPRSRPTSILRVIYIDPTVWPQYTNFTDMTAYRTYNGAILRSRKKPLNDCRVRANINFNRNYQETIQKIEVF